MTVSKCPICQSFLVGYKWEKTSKGKNWIKHPQKGWHDCPKKKFSKKTAGQSRKLSGAGVTFDYVWDSDEHGHYCVLGHFITSNTEELPDKCPKCGKSTASGWYR